MPRPWSDLDALVAEVEDRATHLGSTIHGPSHWRAVGRAAAALADDAEGLPAGATTRPGPDAAPDRELLLLFALLHDAKREDDGRDLDHGPRAAVLLGDLRDEGLLTLGDGRAATLALALREHTNGTLSADPTVACAWDADRLLIGRVGLVPDARFCSTAAGRRRADRGDLPPLEGPGTWAAVAAALDVG